MNLTEARQELAQALNDAGVRAFDALPDRVVPPYAVVYAGDPWFEPSQFDGEWLGNFQIRVFAPAGSLNKVHDTFDVTVMDAVKAIQENTDWQVTGIDQPVMDTGILATSINVQNIITLTGGN